MAAWDRQPKEPPKAYQHFTVYRDSGPGRNLQQTCKITGVSYSTISKASADWNWTARCDQWDAHLQATHDRAMVDEAARRGRRRMQTLDALLGVAAKGLKRISDSLDRADGKITLAEVSKAIDVAVKLTRLEEGLATARTDGETNDWKLVIDRMPADLRAAALDCLKEAAPGDADPPAGIPPGPSGAA